MGEWNMETDVLVVGSGAAGLSAAIAAADAGMRTVVIESTDKWGGTTNLSGGGLWMPTNPLMAKHGIPDSVDEALTYMQAAIGRRAGELAGAPARVRRDRARAVPLPGATRRALAAAKDYPDYYPDRPGGKIGRSIEVEPFDTKVLGSAASCAESACTGSGRPWSQA